MSRNKLTVSGRERGVRKSDIVYLFLCYPAPLTLTKSGKLVKDLSIGEL